VQGELDLKTWNGTDPISLEGPWYVIPGYLASGLEDALSRLDSQRFDTIVTPRGINPGDPDLRQPKTYVLKLKNLDGNRPLALLIPGVNATTARFSIYHAKTGELSFQLTKGRLHEDPEKRVTMYANGEVEGLPYMQGEAWMLVSMATFRDFYSTKFGDLKFVPREEAVGQARRRLAEAFCILGLYLLTALYNLALYIQRRGAKGNLYIACLALALAVRSVGTDSLIATLITEPTLFASRAQLFCLFFGPSLVIFFLILFLHETFPEKVSRWLLRSSIGLQLALFGSLLFISIEQILTLVMYQNIGSLILFCWCILIVIKAYRKDQEGSDLVLLGLAIALIAHINDFVVASLSVSWPYLGHYSLVVAIFCLSLIEGRRFANAFVKIQSFNRDLQRAVESQTEKLRLQRDRLQEQQSDLERVHQELKETDEAKTRFFRTISHELRTPLTMILGSLHDSEDESRLRRSMEVATKHAKRLYRLVNQLLDFQKVALAKVNLRTERVDLVTFLQGLTHYVADTCRNMQIDFSLKLLPEEYGNLIIKAQLDALEKIIFNYVGNALKFTPPGGAIRIEVSLVGACVRISVHDSGCGIPKKEQDKLFKIFSQIEGPQQAQKQGTGLGLALVKELAQQMQGRVGVDSEEGQGSTFWVEFPRQVSAADQHAILYVDTEQQAFLEIQSSFAGHRLVSHLHWSGTASEASHILQQYPVQILIVNTALEEALQGLLEEASVLRPECIRGILVDPARPNRRAMDTSLIQAFFKWPLDSSFLSLVEERLIQDHDVRHAPVLDLVYVEDEAHMRDQFTHALVTYSLIERFRIVETATEYRELLKHYRIKLVVCDARLDKATQGVDLLAQTSRVSPDTIRVLFTGQMSADILEAAIREGHAHYIMYKPANFQQEFKVIEDYIAKSRIEQREVTTPGEAIGDSTWHLAEFQTFGDMHQAALESESLAQESHKATVLLVDDVPDMRLILHDILVPAGYRVIHAQNGVHAWDILQKVTCDIIITDWMMPEKTGPELIADLHAHPDWSSIPTIMLTAKADEMSRSQGMRVGASAYLSKPFDSLELISILENLLDLKKKEREVTELNRFISKKVLQRFLPPDLVKELVAGKAIFDDAAKMQPITVLFADLVGFTSSTEKLGPTKIARVLNTFLVRMTDVIFAEGGTIDKFIGDAILVFFGAPTRMDPIEQAQRARICALNMQKALEELNHEWGKSEGHDFQMRIGIHHGPAIVGSFGGEKRSDYTAIGHTVNIASRIEHQAQPGEVLVSREVRDYLEEGHWEEAGRHTLRGSEGEVTLYRLVPAAKLEAA
jgi:signal transduction histidine kinase/class 3 adenylate cyclase/CheY-like chemotaxis protein